MKGLNLDPFDPVPIQHGYHGKIEEIALDMTYDETHLLNENENIVYFTHVVGKNKSARYVRQFFVRGVRLNAVRDGRVYINLVVKEMTGEWY